MIEIRLHGRGGQGAVLASLVIANAAHRLGYHVQVFPEFGVERRGVPVTAFARMDTKPIRIRTKILKPDHILVLDPMLAKTTPVTDGLKPGGWVVINAAGPAAIAHLKGPWQFAWVDGTGIAAAHGIGTSTAPIVNTTMVGAFAKATAIFGPKEIGEGMVEIFGEKAAKNTAAALAAYEGLHVVPDPVATGAATP